MGNGIVAGGGRGGLTEEGSAEPVANAKEGIWFVFAEIASFLEEKEDSEEREEEKDCADEVRQRVGV